MPEHIQNIKPYARLAKYYDSLMDYIDYSTWIADVESLAQEHEAGSKWLDISCGTGSMAIELARRGKDVTAVDLSHEMLNIAERKARDQEIDIEFQQGDMITYTSTQTYDVVINLHDGLNYILELTDTQKFIENSYALLNQGGLLIFDVVTPLLCQTHFRGYREIFSEEDGGYERHTSYDPNTRLVESRFTLTTDDENTIEVESHIQRAYELKNVESLCMNSQFSWWQILDDESLEPAIQKTERMLVVMKK